MSLFESPSSKKAATDEPSSVELCEQIGRLNVELDWLKKSGGEWWLNADLGLIPAIGC